MNPVSKNLSQDAHPPRIARMLGFLANPRGINQPLRLKQAVAGKVVLITGASFGLGRATAKQFAAADAQVLIVARSESALDELAAEIVADGGQVYRYVADLSDIGQVESLIQTILAAHGRVDIVINNAGKSIRRSVTLSFDRFKDYERTNAINYLGPVRLVLGLLPAMQAHGGGQIINVSTIGVRVPPAPRWAAYQASKGAFDWWLRSVAMEMEPFGIRTTSVYMALIYTRMSAPTPIYRVLPGLYPEEAADLIARAAIDQPVEISPPWLRLTETASVLLRRPSTWLLKTLYRYSSDTQAAQAAQATGQGEQHAPSH